VKRRSFEVEGSEVEAVELDCQASLTSFSDADLETADALADEDGPFRVVHASETGDSTNGLAARIGRESDAAVGQ